MGIENCKTIEKHYSSHSLKYQKKNAIEGIVHVFIPL